MTKSYFLLICLFSFGFLSAQEKLSKEEKARREKNIQAGNPFAKFGYKAKIATLSNGKYLEFHDLDSIVTIGTSRWYVYKNKIVGDIVIDSLNPDARPIGDVAGRWISPDPLSEEFPSWSPYAMSFNNPIRYVDPDGRAPTDIIGRFNKSTGQLTIIDKDHYNEKLPTIYVNSSQYKMGGIRDNDGNLTTNQVLVLDNFFTGGKSVDGVVTRDSESTKQNPIDNGTYDLLDNDADTKHEGWFRLDKIDNDRFNDKDDKTDRSGFRLHLGKLSWGCITGDNTEEPRTKDWSVLTEILNTTSTSIVPERRGNQKWNPLTYLTNYGKINVVGEDKIPVEKEEKK